MNKNIFLSIGIFSVMVASASQAADLEKIENRLGKANSSYTKYISVEDNLIEEFELIKGVSASVKKICMAGQVVHIATGFTKSYGISNYSATDEECLHACKMAKYRGAPVTKYCEKILSK